MQDVFENLDSFPATKDGPKEMSILELPTKAWQ